MFNHALSFETARNKPLHLLRSMPQPPSLSYIPPIPIDSSFGKKRKFRKHIIWLSPDLVRLQTDEVEISASVDAGAAILDMFDTPAFGQDMPNTDDSFESKAKAKAKAKSKCAKEAGQL